MHGDKVLKATVFYPKIIYTEKVKKESYIVPTGTKAKASEYYIY